MFQFTPSTRIRRSPFHAASVADGLAAVTTYNHMHLPTGYGDPAAEYDRLINAVSMWDVAAERQIELWGPDAARLAQILSPRDLSTCKIGQGKYVALCNHAGTVINDPILLKLAEDRFWISIADSNILFWARAIAAERGLDVQITEADASPLAVQGPKAEDVIAALFGDEIRKMRYFWFQEHEINGIPVMLARSGWSKQGGFEIYLMDGRRGSDLWQIVKEAGQPFGIGPGNPNGTERIESGLLSWGGDTDDATNPFEIRMGAYVDLDVPDDVIGIDALRRIAAEGPKRHQVGAVIDAATPLPPVGIWAPILADGQKIGDLTCSTWSPRLAANIGFALISRTAKAGDAVRIALPEGEVSATLTALPFL